MTNPLHPIFSGIVETFTQTPTGAAMPTPTLQKQPSLLDDLKALRKQIDQLTERHAGAIDAGRLVEWNELNSRFTSFNVSSSIAGLIESADEAIDVLERIDELNTMDQEDDGEDPYAEHRLTAVDLGLTVGKTR